MASVTMATSEWIQFFKEAGIPPGPAVNYAVMFVDNRIQKSMLMDLNKEILNELGVTVVGDIIAILKHAKVVYRQEMCKAATESVASSQTTAQSELRRNATSAASRMIANSLSRDSPPSTPVRRPDSNASKISITVSNKLAVKNVKAALGSAGDETPTTAPVKRRRVTAEMEGKYVVHMPKGTTPKTKKILEQQAARAFPSLLCGVFCCSKLALSTSPCAPCLVSGLQRTSVFDRLGAETNADTTTGNKPTGVFSRLGDMQEAEEDKAAESEEDDCSALQYAGVLKKPFRPSTPKECAKAGVAIKAKATSSEAQQLGSKNPVKPSAPSKGKVLEPPSRGRVAKRLSKRPLPEEAQDSSVTSSRSRPESDLQVTIQRTLGSAKVLALS
ncbi:uncharacterized protein C19orf47 homolog isoform X2 [Eublepharis macularius]|uniref:Uncharacterized protein C19orf47 homolog isoform X2 n=1 Tax=Eublepharis macularius TaxID=481883 RepID=A0AA97KFM1_EUBMA|nr:uncharacterized protein C19orf47 homolog isoform X2 [Eublepharis macularius]